MKRTLIIPVVFMVLAALAFTAPAAGEAAIDRQAFTLKDGRVHKGEVALDSQVNEVPPEIGGAVRYWSVVGPSASDAVQENAIAVWFFSSEGLSLRHMPLEGEYELQDVYFSPGGERFVLEKGSPMRPDISYEVYGETPEKIGEIAGIRGGLTWIDPVRFVMTRIDDARAFEEEPAYGPAYGWRVSIVMFDASAKKTIVLKESTDTQNFWFMGIIEDGKALSGREDRVKSEGDWGDDEKIESRDIRINIPAAGY
jgi:hypothetical protein